MARTVGGGWRAGWSSGRPEPGYLNPPRISGCCSPAESSRPSEFRTSERTCRSCDVSPVLAFRRRWRPRPSPSPPRPSRWSGRTSAPGRLHWPVGPPASPSAARVYSGVCRGAGRTGVSLAVTGTTFLPVRLGLALVLAGPLGVGPTGVWLGNALSGVVGAVLGFLVARAVPWDGSLVETGTDT